MRPPLPWSVHPRSASPASRPDRSGAPLTALDQRAGTGHRPIPGLRPHPRRAAGARPTSPGPRAPCTHGRLARCACPRTAWWCWWDPSGAGKSAWAAAHFRPEQIVSSDALRALVGVSGDDQRAGTDAFAVLDLVVDRRLARRLLTVVDTLGLDPGRRAAYLALRPPASGALPRRAVRHPRRGVPGPQPVPGPAGAGPGAVRSAGGPRPGDGRPSWPRRGSTACTRPSPSRWCRRNCSAPRPPPAASGARRSRCASASSCPRSEGSGRTTGPAAFADRLAEVAGDRRGGGLHQPVGDGPHGADPPGGPPLGGHARELDDAGLVRGPHQHHPARHPGHRRDAAQPGPSGQDRRHRRRPERRAGHLRPGPGLVGVGACLVRVVVPGHGGALRPARGHPGPAAGDVGTGLAAVPGHRPPGSPRPCAIPARCRSTCRSWSGVRGKRGRCGWLPGTPTPATCSATPRRWRANAPY